MKFGAFLYSAAALWLLPGCYASNTEEPYTWKLNPIEPRGQFLYDSVTGEQWRGKGVAFPQGLPDDVDEWIAVLHRFRTLSAELNLVRIYYAPACAFEGDCFTPFMQAADSLGMYIIVGGSGTHWGWLPLEPSQCGSPPSANGCYKAGGVLGYGQKVVQHFHFPNTLAIVLGNEVDREIMYPYAAMLKAFARDLKAYMNMCNTNADSPTKGTMRMIPLTYSKSDDGGDPKDAAYGDYLFCDGPNVSIDIFGLNMERFCDNTGGPREYKNVNEWVSKKQWPGPFMYTEDGCFKRAFPNNTRDWAQIKDEFANYPMVNAFVGYTSFENVPDWDMFDGPFANSTISQDGINFFHQVDNHGAEPKSTSQPAVTPKCTSNMLGVAMDSVESTHWYDTGPTGWAPSCPKPYKNSKAPTGSINIVV